MMGAAGNVAGPRWLLLFLPLNKPLVASNSAISARNYFPRDKTINSHFKSVKNWMCFSLKIRWQQLTFHIHICQASATRADKV